MSSLGGQWRVIRHYLSLSNLNTEVEKLVQKIKPATPEQWDNFIKKLESAVSTRITGSVEKLQDGQVKSTTVDVNSETKVANKEQEAQQKETEIQQKPAAPGVGGGIKELTVEGLWQGLKLKKDIHLGKISEPTWKPNKHAMSKTSIHSRTAYVVSAIINADSPESVLRRTERLVEHLHEYPEARDYAIKEGAVRALLRVRHECDSAEPLHLEIQGAVKEALALVGHAGWPRWRGANVLSLDGGGIRGLIAISLLRELERLTGRRVPELFDLVVGVSTGAIIAAVLASGAGLDAARRMYLTLSRDMFGATSRLGGASRLVLTHSYYDTRAWERLLEANLGEATLARCNRAPVPKLAVVSCVVNAGSRLSPFLFRSYETSYRTRSAFPGTSRAKLWHAVRASAAAPTYFDEFRLRGLLHQDGGIVVNNPAGVALHEARLLFGRHAVAQGTVLSLGTGRPLSRRSPLPSESTAADPPATSWKDKFNKILDSATDTEGVHLVLSDLLPPGTYFRFNPPLLQECAMDEIDEAKLDSLLVDTAAYIRRNQHKLEQAAAQLTRPRSVAQRITDYVTDTARRTGALAH